MNERQQQFLVKARRSIDAAKTLARNAFPDFSASRSYYAMFYCAEALLLKKELSFSSHSAVVSQFGQHFAKTDVLPRHLHEWLLLAKDMRMDGDYALISEITPEFAQTQIDHAEEFLKEIESYLNKTT